MFSNVLIGVDDRDNGRDAGVLARELADSAARLALVRVHDASPMLMSGVSGSLRDAERRRAKIVLGRAARALDIADTVTVCAPSLAQGLLEVTGRRHADLLVLGSRHGGAQGAVHVDDWLLRQLYDAPCAVAVAPRPYTAPAAAIRRIGVLRTETPDSMRALIMARRLASSCDATLKVLEGVNTEEFGAYEEAWNPGGWLQRATQGLDLLVVGSTLTRPLRRLMHPGLSRALLHGARTALLLVPAMAAIPPSGASRPGEVWTNVQSSAVGLTGR